MAQPLDAPPLVDPLGLDDLIEEKLDVLVLLANAVGNPLTLLVAILPKVSRRCGVAAAQALATLPEVDLSPFREGSTDAAVMAIAEGCPQLTSLDLGDCEQITTYDSYSGRMPESRGQPAALHADHRRGDDSYSGGCPELTSLDLSGCRQITDAAVTAVVARCPARRST